MQNISIESNLTVFTEILKIYLKRTKVNRLPLLGHVTRRSVDRVTKFSILPGIAFENLGLSRKKVSRWPPYL
jgi:hypothetical protein